MPLSSNSPAIHHSWIYSDYHFIYCPIALMVRLSIEGQVSIKITTYLSRIGSKIPVNIFFDPISNINFAPTTESIMEARIKIHSIPALYISNGSGSSSSSINTIIRCPIVTETAAGSSIPKQAVRLAWLSKSTSRIFFPSIASA